MEKLKMHTPDLIAGNIAKLAELFPNCVTETKDEKTGTLKRAIDFDQLRQELADHLVEGPRERYHLDWPGKREALLATNAPIAKTLRPFREESVDFDRTRNLFIEGDNLEALKVLQETYLGRVNVIYIDPPYNTGADLIYEDEFGTHVSDYLQKSNQRDLEGNRLVVNTEANGRFHSDWASMMYSRLRLARNLLRDDGLLFVSIDDVEVSNLRKICDEIFGEDNLVTQLVWKKSYGGGAKSRHAVILHEYILMYARQKQALGTIELPAREEVLKYYKFQDGKFEVRGPYRKQPLATNSMDERPNLRFPIFWQGEEIWPEKQWQWSKDRVSRALQEDELVFTRKSDGWTVDYKQYLRNEDGETRGSKLFSLLEGPYTQIGTAEIEKLLGSGKIFTFPKPSELIRHLLGCGSPDDVVLDFFAGSGSTAHAVMELNAQDGGKRRFILVQVPEPVEPESEAFKAGYPTVAAITKERIRRAGASLRADNAIIRPDLDIGFRVLKIDTSNMKDVYYTPDAARQDQLEAFTDNIKEDRTPEDLLFHVLVDWGVDLALPIRQEKVAGKTVFFVDGNALAACFDPNVTEELVKELARRKPLRAVFRDSSYASDSTKINVEQIFKLLSPETEVKSL